VAPATFQKQAVIFFNESAFNILQWLVDASIFSTTCKSSLSIISSLQKVITSLVNNGIQRNFL